MKQPVLFLVFNRPETTARVFEAVRQARPERLYVAADGPRRGEERAACEAARKIASAADWPCEVRTLFREKNLGCKAAVSGGISWFFENEQEGIILEDDCLPDASFFDYCASLLEKYRDDGRVMHIGGANFQDGIRRGRASYYFSVYAHVWGWASWRRAWSHYDVLMRSFPDSGAELVRSLFRNGRAASYWRKVMRAACENKIDTWDYQWLYSIWRSHGVCAVPNVNLVSNIGFGQGSTHTPDRASRFSNVPGKTMDEAFSHPDIVAVDGEADAYSFKHHYSRPFMEKIIGRLRRMF